MELVHESLIARWTTLVRWLDEDQEAAHFRTQLRGGPPVAQGGRTKGRLWRRQAAAEARRWHQRADVVIAFDGLFPWRDQTLEPVTGLIPAQEPCLREDAALRDVAGLLAVGPRHCRPRPPASRQAIPAPRARAERAARSCARSRTRGSLSISQCHICLV